MAPRGWREGSKERAIQSLPELRVSEPALRLSLPSSPGRVRRTSHFPNRWQRTMSVPIVAVDVNQSITIFLLDPLTLSGKTSRGATAPSQVPQVDAAAEQNQPSEQDLAAAQTAYIQALEAQLAEMRSANGKKANEHQ